MGKYSRQVDNPTKSCKARGSNLRTHFKSAREVGRAIRGMKLKQAMDYLEAVIDMKRAVPFRRFTGGCGRHAQAKQFKAPGSQARWPVKSAGFMLDILRNAEANAEMKSLDVDALVITHMQVNRAVQQSRRTYRAHGRINPYMRSPCHIEVICSEREEGVKRGDDDEKPVAESFVCWLGASLCRWRRGHYINYCARCAILIITAPFILLVREMTGSLRVSPGRSGPRTDCARELSTLLGIYFWGCVRKKGTRVPVLQEGNNGTSDGYDDVDAVRVIAARLMPGRYG